MLDPRQLLNSKEKSKGKFKRVLPYLLTHKWVIERDCYGYMKQFADFIDSIPSIGSHQFHGFSSNVDTLHGFYSNHMAGDCYNKIFEIIKMFIMLFYGQAFVEFFQSVRR